MTLTILVEASVSSEPCEAALDDPASGQQDEPRGFPRALDDLQFGSSLANQRVTELYAGLGKRLPIEAFVGLALILVGAIAVSGRAPASAARQ